MGGSGLSAEDVDEYLQGIDEPKGSTLEALRRTILEIVLANGRSAPAATESNWPDVAEQSQALDDGAHCVGGQFRSRPPGETSRRETP
jgi:hypothetical protein